MATEIVSIFLDILDFETFTFISFSVYSISVRLNSSNNHLILL